MIASLTRLIANNTPQWLSPKPLAGLLLALLLVGCSNVQTTVISFHRVDPAQLRNDQNSSIQIVAGDKRLEDTLEFDHHRQLLEQFLSKQGFHIVAADSSHDSHLLGFLSYAIDSGHSPIRSEPSADTRSSEVRYSSAIAVDIVERNNLRGSDPLRLYQGRARSSSNCALITPIFNQMLSALFEDFPGVSGQTQTKTIRSNGHSC